MNLIDQILGLAVLTSPLWLFVLLLIASVWIGFKVSNRFRSGTAKAAAGLGVATLVLVVPFGDEIVGRLYLDHLCATEGGAKVYRTVKLPPEYWDESGQPKFFNRFGSLDRDLWLSKLDEKANRSNRYSSLFAIDKDTSLIKDKSDGNVIAELTQFLYWGGWIRRNLTPHNSASGCKFVADAGFSRQFYGQIFKPANVK
jgi:hypothetical protein